AGVRPGLPAETHAPSERCRRPGAGDARRPLDAGLAGRRVAARLDRARAPGGRDARGRRRLGGRGPGLHSLSVRLAIIADVHGNLPALEAVLADVAEQRVDRLIVNGDLANRGPDTLAVLERMRGTLERDATLGNHDDLMLMWYGRRGNRAEPWFEDPFGGTVGWSAEQLEPTGLLDDIEALPMTLTVEQADAQRLLISHGSPRHYREGYGTELSP